MDRSIQLISMKDQFKIPVQQKNVLILKQFFIEYDWNNLEKKVIPPLFKFIYDTASIFYSKLLVTESKLSTKESVKLSLTDLEIMSLSIMFNHYTKNDHAINMQLFIVINSIPDHLIKYLKSNVHFTQEQVINQ